MLKRVWPWLLAAAAGLAAALAQPGPGLWPLVLLAPGLLLAALPAGRRPLRSGLLGWLAGAVSWAVGVHWVVAVMHDYGGLPLALAVVCLLFMAAVLGAFTAAAAALTGWLVPVWRPWALPAAWVLGEALRQWPPIQFPWAPTAAALTAAPALLGSLPSWGAAGLGWVVLSLGAAAWALSGRATRRSGAALLAVAAGAIGLATLAAPAPRAAGADLRVALVQPGTSLEEKWDPNNWEALRERVTALTAEAAEAAGAGVDLVLWPESAMPYRVEDDPAYRAMLAATARAADAAILLNAVGHDGAGGWTNSAYLATPDGVAEARYDKLYLVPFGEYVPAWARFAFAASLVREVGSFTPGTEPVILPGPVPVGMAICYEVAFGNLTAAEARRGAELLVSLTNDAWYGFSWAPRQHLALAVLRAVETRRWLARAALSGVSACIDPGGRLHAVQPIGASGVTICSVAPATLLTPRARFGDWWLWPSLALLLLALLCGRPEIP